MKQKTQSMTFQTVITLAIIVAVNLLSTYLYKRFDFSEGRVFTLSKTSKTAVRGLKDNFVVKGFISAELPSSAEPEQDFQQLERYLRDLLGEYKVYGGRRFRLQYINPHNIQDFKTQASRNNIEPMQAQIYQNDQISLKDIYFSLVFEYLGRREVMTITPEMSPRLEYEITSIIKRLVKANLPEVIVYSDSTYVDDYCKNFADLLRKDYIVSMTDLKVIREMAPVMVFTGVMDSLSEPQLYNLDQYIMRGGKVVFFQDRINAVLQYGYADSLRSNIFSLLEHYGVQIKPNIVLDSKCVTLNYPVSRQGIYSVTAPLLYPPLAVIQGSKDNIITRNINDILLYFASEINLKPLNKNVSIKPLLKTSPNAGVIVGPEFDVSPTRFTDRKTISSFILPPLTVAVEVKGAVTSYFAKSNNLPVDFVKSNPNAQFIIFGDKEMMQDAPNKRFESRLYLALNAVDYLRGDETMISVRARTVPFSSFSVINLLQKMNMSPELMMQLEPKIKNVLKALNIILPTLLLLAIGLTIMVKHKKYKKEIKKSYEKA